MASKLFNFIALSSFLILACSFSAAPVHALSVDTSLNRRDHLAVFSKKRSDSRRCKSRPTSSLVSTSTHPITHAPSSTNKSVQSAKPATATPNSSSTGKAGIIWVNGDDSTLSSFKTSKTSVLINYSSFKSASFEKAGFDFVCLLSTAQAKADFMKNCVGGYAKYAAGVNEPDQAHQANLSPSAAAALWKEAIEPLVAKGYTTISPAVSNAQQGIPWLRDFVDNACSDCTIHRIALHFYGTKAQDFISYIEAAHAIFSNMMIWVTEVGCENFVGGSQCSPAQIHDFLTEIVAFMDNTDYIEKYFYFLPSSTPVPNYNMENNLMGPDGLPSALGRTYIT
jgi:hypothetical protein